MPSRLSDFIYFWFRYLVLSFFLFQGSVFPKRPKLYIRDLGVSRNDTRLFTQEQMDFGPQLERPRLFGVQSILLRALAMNHLETTESVSCWRFSLKRGVTTP